MWLLNLSVMKMLFVFVMKLIKLNKLLDKSLCVKFMMIVLFIVILFELIDIVSSKCVIVLMMCICFVWNFVGNLFLGWVCEVQCEIIFEVCCGVFFSLFQMKCGLNVVVNEFSDLEKQIFVECYFISCEFSGFKVGVGVVISKDQIFFVMINEEDYLCI